MITVYSNTISVTTDAPAILPFEFTINTNNTSVGSSTSTQFKLPLVSSLALNAVVDWGDGNTDTITTFNQAETLHTYASAGTYTIKITGDLSGWQFSNLGDRLKILNVVSWGVLNISVGLGFRGCTNLTCSATDAPVITSTSLVNYFELCTNFNGAVGNWDVSNVTIFERVFQQCPNFNQDIGSWNMSNATSIRNMFFLASSFNNGGSSSIGNWNVSNVTDMFTTFRLANAFNQDIGNWNVSNVLNFNDFMAGKTNLNYSAANLDAIYNGWSQLSVKPNLTITFGTIKHTAAGTAGRSVLTSAPNNWTITDGGI